MQYEEPSGGFGFMNWWKNKATPGTKLFLIIIWVCVPVIILGAAFLAIISEGTGSPGKGYKTAAYVKSERAEAERHLSEGTRQKIYYDMIATQEQYPGFSNEWNEGVKEAAAKYYNIPMSQINEIIHEGASKHWLQPPPR